MPLPIAPSNENSAALGAAAKVLMTSVLTAARSGTVVNSLADLTKPCRVEPLAVIDQALVDQPYMIDLLKMATSITAGYYLQAVNMVMGVGKIDTLKVFDSLNPNRSVGADLAGMVFAKETYANGLPSLESFKQPIQRDLVAAFDEKKLQASMEDGDNKGSDSKGNKISSGDTQRVYEAENLVVGKLLNVEIQDGENKAKLPVLIRLIPAAVPSDTLTHMFTNGGRDSWGHRLWLVKTGQLRFWRDFVLGQDMIDAHLKALMTDKSGVYKEITDRRRNNVGKALQTGRVSLADASNIAIISADTLKRTAGALYGKIDDMSVRQKIFDNSYLLLLMVVDERFQRVTVYHRGLDMSSSYRLDEVKLAEKSKGQDITEIFKLFSKQMQTNI